jgi:arylsulfatase
MSDTQFDVVIAAYLIPDLARKDFDAIVKLVAGKQLTVEGVAGHQRRRRQRHHCRNRRSPGTQGPGNRRRGRARGGAARAAAAGIGGGRGAAGALIGKFARHRVESGLEEKMDVALPPGSAGVVAIYERGKADTVDATLASAVRKSVAQVDGGGAKKLKAALAEAQAGMGG